jgi:indolepyruvate ferredoxin oxidoreductase beta subunit
MNVYITGVGGQGIGMLSEILVRAADHAGYPVKGVDTHGLAQRGGIVISHLRTGEGIHSPLIEPGAADVVIAMERTEALRAAGEYLRDGGTLLYYDTVWQPFDVRAGRMEEVTREELESYCGRRGIMVLRACREDLEDPRTQNVVLLALACTERLVDGVDIENCRRAMEDLMEGRMLRENLSLFDALTAQGGP